MKETIETQSAKARKLDVQAKRLRKKARDKGNQQWIDTKSRAAKKCEKKAERLAMGFARKLAKADAEAKRLRKEAREKEEQQWIDTKSRAAKRREEKAERQAEASARKALVRLLAKQEEEDLETMLKKSNKKVKPAELQRKREEELQKQEEEEKRKQSRVATKKEYESMILVENENRSVIEASCFDEAIEVLMKREKSQVRKVKATRGKKGDCLLVYTHGEEKPLLIDVLLTV